MKRKLFCLFVCFTMVFVLVGCNSSTDEKNNANVGGEMETADENKNEVWPVVYEAKSKIKEANLFDKSVQIGDKTISIPISLADFIEKTGAQFEDQTLSEDFLMDPSYVKTISMYIEGNSFDISVENLTTEMVALKECTVNSISLGEGDNGVFFAKGITIGSTLTQLNESWGEAVVEDTTSDDLTYYYFEYPKDPFDFGMMGGSDNISSTGNAFTVKVDRNTSMITEIDYTFTDEFNKEETIVTAITFEDSTISYELPIALKEHNISMLGQVYASALKIDNATYTLDVHAPTMGLRVVDLDLTSEEIEKMTLTDELLISAIDSETYGNIEIINNNGKTGTVTGYYMEENEMRCEINFVSKGYGYSFYYNFSPYEQNTEITDAAINEMYSLVKDLAGTISLKK